MDSNKNWTTCDIKLAEDNYKIEKTVCKSCYNENKGENNNNS